MMFSDSFEDKWHKVANRDELKQVVTWSLKGLRKHFNMFYALIAAVTVSCM